MQSTNEKKPLHFSTHCSLGDCERYVTKVRYHDVSKVFVRPCLTTVGQRLGSFGCARHDS